MYFQYRSQENKQTVVIKLCPVTAIFASFSTMRLVKINRMRRFTHYLMLNANLKKLTLRNDVGFFNDQMGKEVVNIHYRIQESSLWNPFTPQE